MDAFSFQPVNSGPVPHHPSPAPRVVRVPSSGSGFFGGLNDAARTAYNPAAPFDEQADAASQAFSDYYDASQVTPDLVSMVRGWGQLMAAENNARALMKAQGERTVHPLEPKAQTESGMWKTAASGLYLSKPGVPFVSLRMLSRTVEVIQAIHRTRNRQVLRFSQRSQKDDVVGWRLRALDPNAQLGPEHEGFLKWLSDWLENGGDEDSALKRRRLGRQDFRRFLGLLVDDALTLDHACVETVPFREGNGLSAFFMRDSSTFYLSRTFGDADEDDIYAYQDMIRTAGRQTPFTYEELAIFQRNLSTDVERVGYGYSELESTLDTIGNILHAMAFTREGLDNNAIPRGILLLSGQYTPAQMQQFRTAWQSKLRGVQNAHALPVLQSNGQQGQAQYLTTNGQMSEMAFVKWIALQASVGCAIYGMDPVEINMESFAVSGRGALGGDDTTERLAASRDKGLAPFLADIESFTRAELISRWVPWATFGFCGIDPGDLKARDEATKRMQTVDELRQSLDMPRHPIGWVGALPADPAMQSAEFSRAQVGWTFNEARAAWGGLTAYPDAEVGNAPINPSMQAAYQTALGNRGADAGGGDLIDDGSDAGEGWDDQSGAGVSGAPSGEEGGAPGGAPDPPGFGDEVTRRLQDLKGGS